MSRIKRGSVSGLQADKPEKIRWLGLITLLLLSGCSNRVVELETPCPDYGRHCPQQWVNEDLMVPVVPSVNAYRVQK